MRSANGQNVKRLTKKLKLIRLLRVNKAKILNCFVTTNCLVKFFSLSKIQCPVQCERSFSVSPIYRYFAKNNSAASAGYGVKPPASHVLQVTSISAKLGLPRSLS